uniref:CCHC-type domain-containing protein n=1 Tax=Cajanus cajan TaxID=3821 RepID=A0A151UFW2_CAJCA
MNNNNRAEVAPNWLEQFQRNHPPTFKGGYDPDAAMNWLTKIEKIFNVMDCPFTQKVKLATFMLTADAHFWWEGALRRMIDGGVHLNWDNFKKVFLEKYFPDDVRSRKEMEFLELNQGNDTVAVIHWGATGSVGGFVSTPSERCGKCGRVGHNQSKCRDKEITCFNCSCKGHISTQCLEPRRTRVIGSGSQIERPKNVGRVFTLSGVEAARSENLIQGTCFIAETPFVVLFDSGATHSFISVSCVQKLNFPVSLLDFDLVVETPTNGPVTTSLVCLKCPLTVSDKQFLVDLICLPLSQLDVILGMDWLSSHHVLLNCYEKSISFGECKSMEFLSAADIKTCLKDNEKVSVHDLSFLNT